MAKTASAPLDLSLDAGHPLRPPLVPASSTPPTNPLGSKCAPSQSLAPAPSPRLPSNQTITSLVSGLIAAHEAYGPPKSGHASSTGILFVVQPKNMNICDERPLEYALWNHDPPISASRVVFGDEVLARTSLTDTRELLYNPPSGAIQIEVSVVYLRAGYDPKEYSAAGYGARLLLERSRAIKCPSLLGHIATFKKVQQALTTPRTLARFLEPAEAQRIGKTFVPMYPLDGVSEAGRQGRALACGPQTAVNYVLKPSLEGGGHNIYRGDIPQFLESVPQELWHTHILMELINPVVHRNILLSPRGMYTADDGESATDSDQRQNPRTVQSAGQVPGPTVSELGIFGVCLWKRKGKAHGNQDIDILKNTEAGWSLKTKPEAVDEMSVVKGYGCFDCLYLVDEETYLAHGKYSTDVMA
jgi:hypothetical protein